MASYTYGQKLFQQYFDLIGTLRSCGDEVECLRVSPEDYDALRAEFKLIGTLTINGVPVYVTLEPSASGGSVTEAITSPFVPLKNAECLILWNEMKKAKTFERWYQFEHQSVFDYGWDALMDRIEKDLDKFYGLNKWALDADGVSRETLFIEKATRVCVKGTFW